MKNLYIFILLFFLYFCGTSQVKVDVLKSKINNNQTKIGLSLSGGGAKGFAHVGVLKMIDSLGIKIDYISGTSMGAIVGGLYASGYTGNDIEKIILETDFYTLIANEKTREENTFFNKSNDKYILTVPIKNGKVNVLPKAISTGQKNIYMLKELFKNVSNIEDFSKFPIPFLCVATNLETGKIQLFEKGDIVNSILASSAFPGLMDPVKVGDSIYIDGAMSVNYPSKPLKDKDIDIIIGVDLNQPLSSREQLNSVIDILNQVIDFGIKKETIHQYEYTDINIKPNLNGLSATSYGDKEKILSAGFNEAKRYEKYLEMLPRRNSDILRAPINPVFSNVYKIDSLILENNHIYNRNYIRGKMNLKVPSMQTYGSINKMIDKLYATNNYKLINYDILQKNSKNYLKINVTEDDTRKFLKFGLHYDEVFKTGLLVNATFKRLIFKNSTISLDLVLGDKTRYYFNYFIDNGYIPGFGIYSSGMNLDLKNNKSEINDNWKWYRNEVFLQSIWRDKYAIGGGMRHEYYESQKKIAEIGNFINPYIFIKSDTQDDKDFPTRGIFLDAEGRILDLLGKETTEKSFQSSAKFNVNIPINKDFTYQLHLFGGFTIGNTLSPYFLYRTGAIFEQKIGNFSSLPGFNFGEKFSENVLTATNQIQFKFNKNFYFISTFSLLNNFAAINAKQILQITDMSTGITAGYKSPFGQIKINYSKAFNKNNNGIFSVILGHWF